MASKKKKPIQQVKTKRINLYKKTQIINESPLRTQSETFFITENEYGHRALLHDIHEI